MFNPSAKWRADSSISTGKIIPEIYDENILSSSIAKNRFRHVITTCDFQFLVKYIDRLIAYQASRSQITFYVGVYSPQSQQKQISKNLSYFKQQYNLSKVVFFQFYCEKLDQINQMQSEEISFDYRINYVRNSRYLLVNKIWQIAKIDNQNFTIKNASTYVIDFDNEFLDDVNSIIKKEFEDKNMVFSWNSAQCQHNTNYPSTLSGLSLDNGVNMTTNHPYKILKAGFTVLSPCPLSRIFLFLYRNYSVGDPVSLISIRLFTFYFSDQLAMLLSLHDIKSNNPQQYQNKIGWIDINTSPLINLNKSQAKCLWYPKGNNFKNKDQQ